MINGIEPTIAMAELIVGFDPKNICCEQCKFCLEDRFNHARCRCNAFDFIISNVNEIDMRCKMKWQK